MIGILSLDWLIMTFEYQDFFRENDFSVTKFLTYW